MVDSQSQYTKDQSGPPPIDTRYLDSYPGAKAIATYLSLITSAVVRAFFLFNVYVSYITINGRSDYTATARYLRNGDAAKHVINRASSRLEKNSMCLSDVLYETIFIPAAYTTLFSSV